MVLRLFKALLPWLSVAAMLIGVSRLPAVEPRRLPSTGITYRQLRHLIVSSIFLVLFLWLALWFISKTVTVLTLLVISIILAVAMRPTVDRSGRAPLPIIHRPMPRPVAIILIYMLLAAVAAGIGLLVVPQLVAEIEKLIANFPEYQRLIQLELAKYPFLQQLTLSQEQLGAQLLGNLSQALSVLLFAVNLISGIVSIGVVLVFTFFLIMDAEPIHEHVASLLPPSQQEQFGTMTAKMGRKIEGWLKGTLLLALILGLATGIGMWALGMPYPLLLGLAAGLFELVPLIGPYLGAAPAILLAFFQPLWKLVAVVIFYILMQQIENNVLAPHIMGRNVDMPPLLVILALLIGAQLMGIIGAVLAVPIAAVLHVLWTDLVVPEIRRRQAA